MFSPRTRATAVSYPITPVLASVIVIATVADDDWMIAVTSAPRSTIFITPAILVGSNLEKRAMNSGLSFSGVKASFMIVSPKKTIPSPSVSIAM